MHTLAALTQSAPPIASLRLQEKVPFITAWSGEAPVSPQLVWRGERIGYVRERGRDRDPFGVLWRRVVSAPGRGRPAFGTVHNARQRQALGGLLCQVCARPTRPEATGEGVLFLLGRDDYEYAPWPAPIDTTHPPVCVRCATISVQACPYLRNHYVAVRCRAPRLYGVSGVMHVAGRGTTPVATSVDPVRTVAYESVRKGLVHAAQAVARLDRYTLVDLASESAALAA